MQEFEELLYFSSFLNTPVRQLSLGQRIISDFALAALHNPKVMFLDEPTIGLDVNAKENIIKFLQEINVRKNVTMLITSHDLSDIERLCGKIMIINMGQKIYEGSKDRLIREYCNDRCTIIMKLDGTSEHTGELTVPGCEITWDGKELRITFSRHDRNPTDIIMEVVKHGMHIRDFTIQETTLEDAIKVLYRR